MSADVMTSHTMEVLSLDPVMTWAPPRSTHKQVMTSMCLTTVDTVLAFSVLYTYASENKTIHINMSIAV